MTPAEWTAYCDGVEDGIQRGYAQAMADALADLRQASHALIPWVPAVVRQMDVNAARARKREGSRSGDERLPIASNRSRALRQEGAA